MHPAEEGGRSMRAIARFASTCLTVLALAGVASAAAPRVVRSTPANGATNVPLNVGRLEVVFDQDMHTGSNSVCTVPGRNFPPLRLKGSPWRDARTFVLALNRLEPNTTYTIQLNGPQRQGFRSAGGQPLPVAAITFTTGTGAPAPNVAGHGMMPFPTMPAAPAGYRIINVANDFIAYHDTCKGMTGVARAASWDAMLEARHRAFFNDAIYRKKQGAERERFKQWCIRTFWGEVAPKIATIRTLNQAIPGQITETVQSFRKQFPDYTPATGFYVTVSFTFRGKVVDVAGKDVFGIGLDRLDPARPEQIEITIAHELFHLYHFRTFRASGGLYRTLWAEGLAVYASAVVVPRHRDSAYLGFPAQKMNRCRELLPAMARELKKEMGNNGPRIKRIYFGAEPNDTPIPPEAGYYVGLQIVKSLARNHSLRELARMDAKTVYQVLARELSRLGGSP